MSKLLGIDYGRSKCGLAIGDLETRTAVPLKTVSFHLLKKELRDLILSENIVKIIVGLPLNMGGQETEQTIEAVNFMKELRSIFNLEVIAVDERLTTLQAQKSGQLRKGGGDDAVAAMHILQSFLDRNG